MARNIKNLASLINKTCIKLKNRRWIQSYTFYSNDYFVISFENEFQRKICKRIIPILRDKEIEIREFSNCFSFKINRSFSYGDFVKINLRRVWRNV